MEAEELMIPGTAGRLSVRTKGMSPRPAQVVVLVQGSNLPGEGIFDLSVAGEERYSLMDEMVALGFGAVTFSVRGYGTSELAGDPFDVTTEAAMEDLGSVLAWLREGGHPRPHLLAFSWGGRVAGRYLEDHPDHADRLVLYTPARGGGGLVLPAPGPDEGWFTNSSEFYLNKFDPDLTSEALRQELSARVETIYRRSPNGIRRENASPTTPVDPRRVTRPTLMIYGVRGATASYMLGGIGRGEFFEALATDDKAFVIVPDAGDFAHFQKGRFRFYAEVGSFLTAGERATGAAGGARR